MVKFPVRKCYHVAKLIGLVLLVTSVLALWEQWRGGRRAARAAYMEPAEAEYERQILEDEARIVPGLGEGGAAAHLVGEAKRLGEESEKKLAINVYLSDRIAYNRTLNDYRNPACKRVVYDAELPSASVIIIFHNEPYSVVVRTVWSVVNSARRDRPWFRHANYVERDTGRTMTLGYPGQDPNSPFVYLKEIILVDDNSTLPELKGKLSHYVRTRMPPDLIRILRLPDRVGLTRARLAGARYAAGDVLVFLDAHCEAQVDWLRPQLQRIKDAPHSVVMPIIDVIESSDFYYSVQDPHVFQGLMLARMRGARSARGDVLVFLDAHCEAQVDWLRPLLQRVRHKRDAVLTPLIDVIDQTTFQLDAADNFQVGGFTFIGHFTWIDVPEREKKRRGSDIAPTWSPTMAGGLFAIGRLYYWELGAYDEQMAGWGGENLEMSFRIWQCGGTLETIPCSRVGHVFRSFHPYGMPAHTDTHGINTARMAEVWMDEYKELFYLHRPDLRKNPKIGDITHRRVLREKLQCKSFQWYLDHVYREKFVPVRDTYGYGRFRNPISGLCLDTLQRDNEGAPLGVYPCHDTLQGTQYLTLSLTGQLRDEERCVELQFNRRESDDDVDLGRRLLMVTCHDKPRGGQRWKYLHSKQLQHASTRLCVDAGHESGADVRARRCRPGAPEQAWEIDYSEENDFRMPNGLMTSEQEQTLQKLRGQRPGHKRRISRSLMSVSENGAQAASGGAVSVPTPLGEGDRDRERDKDSNTVRRHSHKKKRHKKNRKHGKAKRSRSKKNKFILKLVRTLMNDSEDHLEVDIHCKHRQLFPNNSFVRDLVTILNEKNIKVINNGRVFERNRVTEIGKDTRAHRDKVLEKLPVQRPPEPPPAEEKQQSPQPSQPSPFQLQLQQQLQQQMQQQQQQLQQQQQQQQQSPAGGRSWHSKRARKKTPSTQPTEDKKIIIEDFVEVTPAAQPVEPVKHGSRKRKHRPRPALQPGAVPRPPATAGPLPPPDKLEPGEPPGARVPPLESGPESGEDTAMVSAELPAVPAHSGSKRDGEQLDSALNDQDGQDDWAGGSRGVPPNSTLSPVHHRTLYHYQHEQRDRRDQHDRRDQRDRRYHSVEDVDNDIDETPSVPLMRSHTRPRATGAPSGGGRPRPAPLKVVMKSNLTFNLGDEFFKWRAADDVAELLGELAIPMNSSRAPAPHALQASLAVSPQGGVSRPRPPPARRAATSAADEENSSSSSESTSGEA